MLESHNKNGRMKATSPAISCAEAPALGDRGGLVFRQDNQRKARQALCSVPMSSQIHYAGINARVFDIFGIRRRLNSDLVLAEVSTAPIYGENVIFARYGEDRKLVIIDLKNAKTNFCLPAQLQSVDTEKSDCKITLDSASSPFFTRYNLALPADGQATSKTCRFAIIQSTPAGKKSESMKLRIDWLTGEYTSIESQSAGLAVATWPTPTAVEISLHRDEGCGSVITQVPQNPKLRSQSFGVGDLWCSHY